MKKYIIVLLFSVMLIGCGKNEVSENQEKSTMGSGSQQDSSGSVMPKNESAIIPQKNTLSDKKDVNEATPPSISADPEFFTSVCTPLAIMMHYVERFDQSAIKECGFRSAIEAKDFKYCINEIDNYGQFSQEEVEDGLNDCARTVMLRAVEKAVEKSGSVYPKNFCENIYKEVESGGRGLSGNEYKEMLNKKFLIEDCYSVYAFMSKSPEICQDENVWISPSRMRIEDIMIQLRKKNDCVWAIHRQYPKELSAKQACHIMQEIVPGGSLGTVSFGEKTMDENGSCGSTLSNPDKMVQDFKKIASAEHFRKELQSYQKLAEEKGAKDKKMSQEMSDLLR